MPFKKVFKGVKNVVRKAAKAAGRPAEKVAQVAKKAVKSPVGKTLAGAGVGSIAGGKLFGPVGKVLGAGVGAIAARRRGRKNTATASEDEDMPTTPGRNNLPIAFKKGGSVRNRAAGSPPKGETRYEVLGRSVTKEQYDAASKEMDRPKSKVEEDMDDFAKQAKERAKMKAKGMKSGGMADKTGRAMTKTTADAKGRAMSKKPKMMAVGGMMKKGYAAGGAVSAGKATRGYGAARKGC
jgi:hypothetical protein